MSEPSSLQHSRAAVPLAPALDTTLFDARMPRRFRPLDRRVLWIVAVAAVLAGVVGVVARLLTALIGLVTNLVYYGTVDATLRSPADHHLGAWAILLPVAGGLVVGVMARFGSRAIRGHGIPEAMEQVLRNESRIPPIITWLKPASSAVAIGTGGPFGAEGPIIATGGAMGSLLAQLMHVTADERKTLLAAGAVAGMAAIFATPIAAVLLAIELLLFERKARSLIPVATAAMIGAAVHACFEGVAPVFPMPALAAAPVGALAAYVAMGAAAGLAAVAITRLTYGIEDAFERLPVHWMWWPAIGGLAVGIVGWFMPRTLGVGYDNITLVLGGGLGLAGLLALGLMKLCSWSIALGSGTSGGTLAPMFTIGGAFGGALGLLVASAFPELGVDPRMAALVCMAAVFAGASRAFLTSVVFAFEATQQVHGLLPLLGACAAAYLVSGLLMRNTIMTEKIVRRGVRVPSDYSADHLDSVHVRDVCTQDLACFLGEERLADACKTLEGGNPQFDHHSFPVLRADGVPCGLVARRDVLARAGEDGLCIRDVMQPSPAVIGGDHSLRDAADHMVECGVGRLLVIDEAAAGQLLGIVTRADLLDAHRGRLRSARQAGRHLRFNLAPVKPESPPPAAGRH